MTNHNMHTQALWKHTEEKKPRGCNNSNTIESADQMTKAVEEWTHKKSCPSIEVMNFVAEFCFTVFRLPFEYSNFADWMCNGRNFSDNEPRLLIVRFSFQPFNFHFHEPVISLIVIPLTLHHPHYSRSNETCHSFFLLSFHQNSSAVAIGWWNFTAARFYNFRTNFHRASLTRVVIWADCCCCCCCCYCAFFSRVLFRNTSCSHTNWKLKLLCSLFNKLKWVSNSSNSKYKRKSK